MTPRFISQNAPNRGNGSAILTRQLVTRKCRLSDVPDHFRSEFRFMMPGSFWPIRHVSTFAHHVLRVFRLGTEKQMRRIDTERRIAPMQHAHSLGDSAVVKRIRKTMRRQSAYKQRLLELDKGKVPVFSIVRAGPQPASIGIRRLLHFGKEAFSDTLRFVQGVPPVQESTGAATGTLTTSPVFCCLNYCMMHYFCHLFT